MTMVSMSADGPDEQMMAAFWVAAEAADFHWEARREERWLGSYESLETHGDELDRVAILGLLQGRRFAGIVIVDGDGAVHDLLRCERFESADAAGLSVGRLR